MGLVSFGWQSWRAEQRATVSSGANLKRALGVREIRLPASEHSRLFEENEH